MAGALIRWMNICKFWNRLNITRWLKSHFDFPLFMQSCASIFSKVLWRNKHRETSNMNLLCIRNTLSYFRSHDIQCRPLKPRLDLQPFASHSRPEIVAGKQGLALQQLFHTTLPYKSFRPSCPPPPLSTGILYSPQFRSHQGTKMAGRRTQRSTSTSSRKNH